MTELKSRSLSLVFKWTQSLIRFWRTLSIVTWFGGKAYVSLATSLRESMENSELLFFFPPNLITCFVWYIILDRNWFRAWFV